MSNRSWAVGTVAAVALATFAADVSAKGIVASGKGFWKHPPIRHRHVPFGYAPYGGVFVAGQMRNEPVEASQPVIPVIQASYALKCSHSEEIKVVPSLEMGRREITIRRC